MTRFALALLVLAMFRQAGQVRDSNSAGGSATLSGVVVTDDASARPIGQVIITLKGIAPAYIRVAASNADGSFTFSNLPGGSVSVIAEKATFLTTYVGSDLRGNGPAVPFNVVADSHATLNISLTRGGVLAGTVVGVTGRPAPNVPVAAYAVRTTGGVRMLDKVESAGGEVTDDRGRYRLWGLLPGTYIVAGEPTNPDGFQLPSFGVSKGSSGLRARYVSVYYPGVTEPETASTVTLGPGDERDGIDFALHYSNVLTVDGVVVGLDGQPESDVAVDLQDPAKTWTALTDEHGRFRFDYVIPGTATVSANDERSGPTGAAVGQVQLTLDTADQHGVTVVLQPASDVRGRVIFEGSAEHQALQRIITLVPAGNNVEGRSGLVDDSRAGEFSVRPVPPGRYTFRAYCLSSTPWRAKAVFWNGRDLLDGTIDVHPGEMIEGITVVFSDQQTDLAGALTTAAGKPAAGYQVVVFPVDHRWWTAGSRRIASAPLDANGRYDVRGLPPGDYLLAAVRAFESRDLADGSWLDQVSRLAIRITLAEGEHRQQDLRISK
jgi:hypothetical protein